MRLPRPERPSLMYEASAPASPSAQCHRSQTIAQQKPYLGHSISGADARQLRACLQPKDRYTTAKGGARSHGRRRYDAGTPPPPAGCSETDPYMMLCKFAQSASSESEIIIRRTISPLDDAPCVPWKRGIVRSPLHAPRDASLRLASVTSHGMHSWRGSPNYSTHRESSIPHRAQASTPAVAPASGSTAARRRTSPASARGMRFGDTLDAHQPILKHDAFTRCSSGSLTPIRPSGVHQRVNILYKMQRHLIRRLGSDRE
jgi:hypothetical protein